MKLYIPPVIDGVKDFIEGVRDYRPIGWRPNIVRDWCLVILAGAFLASCSTAPVVGPAPAPSSLASFASFTVADLQTADADAVAHSDAISHACYPALIQFVQSLPTGGGTVAGAFSAFQQARDVRRGVQNGLPDYLKLGCAALVADEIQLVTKLGLIGAGAAATGGASVFVPFVPIQ